MDNVEIRIFVSFFEENPVVLYHSRAILPNIMEELHVIIEVRF